MLAAAMEGALLGYPALATSLASREDVADFRAAAEIILRLVMRFEACALPPSNLLNVNIPASGEIKGTLVTRLSRRHKDTTSVRQLDPKNRPVFWIGPTGSPGFDAGLGTDFHAVPNDYLSVTPIQTDMTAFGQLEVTNAWLNTNAQLPPP